MIIQKYLVCKAFARIDSLIIRKTLQKSSRGQKKRKKNSNKNMNPKNIFK